MHRSYNRKRARRLSERRRKMALARWKKDRERRMDGIEERRREMMIEAIENLPKVCGDPTHIFQIQNLATGKVDRWLIRRGDRVDRVTMENMKGKRTASHGWTWILNHLRGYLAGTKYAG